MHMPRFLFALLVGASAVTAQQYDPALYGAMRWRQIGPFRAGRGSAVAGIPGQENVASIGAIAVAPSNHEMVDVGNRRYVGTQPIGLVRGAGRSALGRLDVPRRFRVGRNRLHSRAGCERRGASGGSDSWSIMARSRWPAAACRSVGGSTYSDVLVGGKSGLFLFRRAGLKRGGK